MDNRIGAAQMGDAWLAMRLWVAGNEAPGPGRDAMIRALQGHGGRVGTLAQRQVQDELAEVWRLGYGPADLVHLLRRAGSPTHAGIVAAAVIDDHDRRGCRSGPATAAWQDQVEGLRRDGTARPAVPDTLGEALEVWAILRRLPSVPPALPPDGPGHGTPVDTAVLTRVRALLRKAESTEFEAEAEAFVAKAQELITRHAIDLARLPEDTGAPTGTDARRILLDDPYVDAKATLVVAEANRARSIYSRHAGGARCSAARRTCRPPRSWSPRCRPRPSARGSVRAPNATSTAARERGRSATPSCTASPRGSASDSSRRSPTSSDAPPTAPPCSRSSPRTTTGPARPRGRRSR